uniref:phytanoyl-CoA dioxygenase family protein n=1 Tax=Candidatus Entotheonella palauensis TaxID=93172 RepID=UPI000B7D49FD
FLENGYLVLREVIPPAQLDELRTSFETLVKRQKVIWSRERKAEDPPGGVWETHAQPRLVSFDALIDEVTARAVEVWLHENTLGVSRQLLSVPEAASVAGMMLMCSPVRDHGPARWHRDVHPIDMAPMASLQSDLLENGPKYVQWNIPLYDDDVLWVIPGSHRRLNTDAENRQLLADPHAPLPGGIPVELKAGDGVVYVNYLLHWGSNYSTRLRRTIHGGHSIFPYYPDLSFTNFLSPAARDTFERWDQKSAKLQGLSESALRAVINQDATTYIAALDELQPRAGEQGKRVLTIYLCKAAYHIYILKHAALDGVTEEARRRASNAHPISINWGPQFAERFTPEEAEILWQRFERLDAKLQADREHFVPGFQSGPMHYFFEEMPADFGVEEFVASWGRSH